MAGDAGRPQRRAASPPNPLSLRGEGESLSSESSLTPLPSAGGRGGGDEATAADPLSQSGELLRRARDLLLERGEPLSTADLARHMFGSAPLPAGMASP